MSNGQVEVAPTSQPPLWTILLSYSEGLLALRILADSAGKYVPEVESEIVTQLLFDGISRDLTPQGVERLSEFWAMFVRKDLDIWALMADVSGAVWGHPKPTESSLPPEEREELAGKLASILQETSSRATPYFNFQLALMRLRMRPASDELVRRVVIVSAVSAFEALLGSLMRYVLRKSPQYVSEGKEFSLGDLIKSGSIDFLIESSIDRRIDAVLRGDFDSWAKWFAEKSPVPVEFASLALDWTDTKEIFKRRNAVVHTNGCVNRDYKESIDTPLAVGSELVTSSAYIHAALERLAVLGTLTLIKIWQSEPNEGQAALAFAKVVASSMSDDAGYWRGTARIFRYLKAHENSEKDRLMDQVAEWTALLKTSERDAALSAVSTWDTSALSPRWQLTRDALLGDLDAAFERLPGVLQRGELTLSAIKKSDRFQSLVADPRFAAFDVK